MALVVPPPSLAGFADAQQRLRGGFGEPVTFLFAAQVTFPPGTPLDPDTGRAYDPLVAPLSVVVPSAAASATVFFRALTRGAAGGAGEATPNAAGWRPHSHVMLICDIQARPQIEGALQVILRGDYWEVTAQKPDGIGAIQRFLTYARRMGAASAVPTL